MNKQDGHSSIIFFEEFIEFLRHNGFQVGADTHIESDRLLEHSKAAYSTEELKILFTSIFVSDKDQQATFHQLFDVYFEKYADTQTLYLSDVNLNITPEETKEDSPSLGLKFLSRRRFYWAVQLFLLIGLGFMGIQAINCYVKTHSLRTTFYCATGLSDQSLTTRQKPSSNKENDLPLGEKDEVLPNQGELSEAIKGLAISPTEIIPENIEDLKAKWYHKYGLLAKILIIVLVVSAFFFYELFRLNRKKLLLKREKGKLYKREWKLPSQQTQFNLYTEEAFYEASRKLREGGSGPKYLVLIEKRSEQDHQVMLFDQLMLELSKQGISIDRYFFEQDPRLCWKKQYIDDIYLEDLYKKYPDNRLIILGNTEAYFDPLSTSPSSWTNMLNEWKDVALVTSQNPLNWGRREVELARNFILLPATIEALGRMVDIFTEDQKPSLRYWLEQNKYPIAPDEDTHEVVAELKRYFDTTYQAIRANYQAGSGHQLFEWVCATAIYPELSWDLTLLLGNLFSSKEEKVFTPQNLLKIVRLPWFRDGYIPDEIREQLIEELDEEKQQKARELIVEVLEANPPPVGSSREAEYYLNLAVQQAHLQPSLATRVKLIKQAQDYSLNYELSDQTVIKELNELPDSMLHIPIPEKLKKIVFNQGIITMGIRSWIRAAAATVLVFMIVLNINPNRLDRVETFAGNDYFLNGKEDRMRYHTYLGNTYLTDSIDYDMARQHYTRALHYKSVAKDSNYLTPDYNLAVLNLELGDEEQANQQFAEVQEQGDSLLAIVARKSTSAPEGNLKDIVARANLNQGLIALRGGDIESAELKIKQAETLLDAKYSLALMELTKPKSFVLANNYEPLEKALLNIRAIYELDPSFFYRQDTVYLKRLLDSLAKEYGNSSGTVLIEEIRIAMRGDTVPQIPIPLNKSDKGTLIDGQDLIYFEEVGPLTPEGLILVKLEGNGKFGFIHDQKDLLIASGFDFAQSFVQGRAAVKQEAKWGYIDTEGKLIIPPTYKDARDFSLTNYGLLYASVKKGTKWGSIDKEGRIMVPFEYEKPIIFSKTDPLAAVQIDGKYGYIDPTGQMVIPARFERAERFIGGVARVIIRGYKSKINRRGKYVDNPPPEKWEAKQELVIDEHKGSINYADFSPSGRLMATASHDLTAKVWRDRGKVLLLTLSGHSDWVRSVGFIPNPRLADEDQQILTASKDKTAIVWNRDGSIFKRLEGAKSALWHAVFSTDGNLVATASEDKIARIYNLRASNELPIQLSGHSGGVNFVEFSPTGDTLLTASDDGTIRLWSKQQNWDQVMSFNARTSVLAAHFSPNGRFIAAGGKDKLVRLWAIKTQTLRIYRSHTDWVSDVVFSPDNKYLLSSSYDRTVKLWTLDAKIVLNITKHRSAVKSAVFSPSGKYIITASWDRTVRVWEIAPI